MLPQILALCFRIFCRWLDQYEPHSSDFPPPHRAADSCPPPGFRLCMQLHSKSELLRLVLATLEEALLLLEARKNQPGKVSTPRLTTVVEECSKLYNNFEKCLKSQRSVFEKVS